MLALRASGDHLRQAQETRALVAGVRQAIQDGDAVVAASVMELWERCASAEADKTDPIRSGQYRTHLNEPMISVDDE